MAIGRGCRGLYQFTCEEQDAATLSSAWEQVSVSGRAQRRRTIGQTVAVLAAAGLPPAVIVILGSLALGPPTQIRCRSRQTRC